MNRPAAAILAWAGLQVVFGIMLLIWARGGTPWLLLIAGGAIVALFALFVDPPSRLVRPSAREAGAVLLACAVAAILTGLFAGGWLVILGSLAGVGSIVLLVAETRDAG